MPPNEYALDNVALNSGNKRLLAAWLVAVMSFAAWVLYLYSWVGTSHEHIVCATLTIALFVAIGLVVARASVLVFVLASVVAAICSSKKD